MNEPEGAPDAPFSIDEDIRQELWDVQRQRYAHAVAKAFSSGEMPWEPVMMSSWSTESPKPDGDK
jgi:hypothetical protein